MEGLLSCSKVGWETELLCAWNLEKMGPCLEMVDGVFQHITELFLWTLSGWCLVVILPTQWRLVMMVEETFIRSITGEEWPPLGPHAESKGRGFSARPSGAKWSHSRAGTRTADPFPSPVIAWGSHLRNRVSGMPDLPTEPKREIQFSWVEDRSVSGMPHDKWRRQASQAAVISPTAPMFLPLQHFLLRVAFAAAKCRYQVSGNLWSADLRKPWKDVPGLLGRYENERSHPKTGWWGKISGYGIR